MSTILQLVIFGLASIAQASISTKCVTSNVCFSLNIPEKTITRGSGDIYVQISGPTSYSWLGLAQGRSMAGANYFIIYTDSTGTNITLSPRLGSGHIMPTYNSAAQMTLLAGSGVSNGIMTANIKCSSCASWLSGSMDLAASSTSWIWSYKSGSSLNSDSMAASIVRHDSYGGLTFDSSAQGGNDANPFLKIGGSRATGSACSSVLSSSEFAAATYSSSSSNGYTTTTTQHNSQHTSFAEIKGSNELTAEMLVKRAVSGSNCVSGNGESTSSAVKFTRGNNLLAAIHGIMAAAVFCLVFPMGGVMIRLLRFSGLVWAHGIIQVVAYAAYIAAAVLGVKLAQQYDYLKNKHSIIGLVLVAALFLQAPLGYIHHVAFKRTGKRTGWSYMHIWIARIAIPLGIINAIFGLRLAQESLWKTITVGAVGGCMWVMYLISIFIDQWRRSSIMRRKRDRLYRSGRMKSRTNSTRELNGNSRAVREQYYTRPYFNKHSSVYVYTINDDENDNSQMGFWRGGYFWPLDSGDAQIKVFTTQFTTH